MADGPSSTKLKVSLDFDVRPSSSGQPEAPLLQRAVEPNEPPSGLGVVPTIQLQPVTSPDDVIVIEIKEDEDEDEEDDQGEQGEEELEGDRFYLIQYHKVGYCPLCDKIFADIKVHVSQHTPMKYVCKHCNILLSSQLALHNHISKQHPGDTWICTHCEQRFVSWQSLKSHFYRNHSEAILLPKGLL